MIPAAVNHTEMKIETNWANRMELDVLSMLRYCKMSGTVINLRARRNRKPSAIENELLKNCSLFIYFI